MYKLNFFTAKYAAIALTIIASLSMTSTVQAHNDDYLPLVPFILYNVLTQPRQHSHQQQHLRHEHYQKPSRLSHSKGGYSQKRLIKKHRRF